MSTLYQTPEDFYEAEVSDQATLRDGSSHLWLIWCDEQGDWWGAALAMRTTGQAARMGACGHPSVQSLLISSRRHGSALGCPSSGTSTPFRCAVEGRTDRRGSRVPAASTVQRGM